MSNYDWKKFTIPLMFGVGIDIIILVLNCITKGENLIFSSLTQGEVLTGIVLAFPALITWNISIKDRVQLEQEKSENETKQLENRTRQLENEKRRIAQQVLDVVKYYDEQLYEITNEVRKDGTLSSQKSSKIVYIIESFDKLFKELKTDTNIHLDFVQLITVICAVPYPDNLVDEPQDEQVISWKENLKNALTPALLGLEETRKLKALELPIVKYFSLIDFREKNIKEFSFKNKCFVECTFSKENIEANDFVNCKFIDCIIMEAIND